MIPLRALAVLMIAIVIHAPHSALRSVDEPAGDEKGGVYGGEKADRVRQPKNMDYWHIHTNRLRCHIHLDGNSGWIETYDKKKASWVRLCDLANPENWIINGRTCYVYSVSKVGATSY